MEQIKGAIIILGSKNDDKGILFPNGKRRTDKAIEVFLALNGEYKLLPTGGFGAYFNTTDKPHALYVKHYLLSKNIKESDILPIAESLNTIEDAKKSKTILDNLGITNVIIVTSNYHSMRAKLIFRKVFGKGYTIKTETTPSTYTFTKQLKFWYHEIRQIIKILLGIIKI